MRGMGLVVRLGDRRYIHKVLVWKPGERRPLGRPRRRWEDNIKVDFKGIKRRS
jgi:hypothetical protein